MLQAQVQTLTRSFIIFDLSIFEIDSEQNIVVGNPEMVRLLLDGGAGASVNFKDSIGDTSIIYAAYGMGEGKHKF